MQKGKDGQCYLSVTLLWQNKGAENKEWQKTLFQHNSQVAEEVFLLSRTVRTFGTEQPEKERYQRRLGILRHISIRQAAAYLLYLTSNSFLFNLTKVKLSSSALTLT